MSCHAAPPSQLDASTPVNPPPTGALHRSSLKRFDCVFSNKTNCDALCLDVRTRLEAWHPPISVWQQKTNIPKGDAKHLIYAQYGMRRREPPQRYLPDEEATRPQHGKSRRRISSWRRARYRMHSDSLRIDDSSYMYPEAGKSIKQAAF
jgi:hypothetical protein